MNYKNRVHLFQGCFHREVNANGIHRGMRRNVNSNTGGEYECKIEEDKKLDEEGGGGGTEEEKKKKKRRRGRRRRYGHLLK